MAQVENYLYIFFNFLNVLSHIQFSGPFFFLVGYVNFQPLAVMRNVFIQSGALKTEMLYGEHVFQQCTVCPLRSMLKVIKEWHSYLKNICSSMIRDFCIAPVFVNED